MQAIILAAGKGQRLAPLTDYLPKCLIPIADRPLLSYQIGALRKWGVDKICVVAGSHKEKVEQFLKNEKGIRLIENPDYQTTNIIASFWYALAALDLMDDFIVIAGDVIFEDSIIQSLIADKTGDLVLCVARKPCGEEEVKVMIEGNLITRLGKKLDPRQCTGEFLGVFKATRQVMPEIREMVSRIIDSKQVQGYLFDMINRLIQEKQRRVKAFDIRDAYWDDIDFPEDVHRVQQWFTSKNIV